MTISHSTPPTNRRQQIIGIIFVVIIAVVGWQIYSMFFGGGSSETPVSTTNNTNQPNQPPPPPQQPVPKPTAVLPKPVLSAKESEQIKIQKQNEERYIAAISQLQMLKVEQQIAETNKAIFSAKLETVKAEKSIASYMQPTITGGGTYIPSIPSQPGNQSQESLNLISQTYSVISISQLQGKWSAVLTDKDKLYQVSVGDIVSNSGAKIVNIDNNGVVIKLGDEERKLTLVSII